jgi:hypothetical protein
MEFEDDFPRPISLQFRLRTLLAVFPLVALSLTLWKLGGRPLLMPTLILALGVGGAITLLCRKKTAATLWVILAGSSTGALIAEIGGIYLIEFNAAEWNNPLGKMPYGVDTVMWYGIWGALAGAIAAAVVRARMPDSDSGQA